MYPNPSSFYIACFYTISNKEMQFQIFNALGILVKEVTIYLTTQIDISNFANGVYFISVKNQPNQMWVS
ncbi:MAG: T9SS type A sorting domain-containing protein [Saprospiraceae bacterium]|nr:T9SS type A sorting domain-containing protein [Saprospiraceae bacterium]